MTILSTIATQDAYVSATQTTTNWNTNELKLKDPYNHEIVTQFDISSIPATASLTSASLFLYFTTISASSHIDLKKMGATFDESTITYATLPSLGASDEYDLSTVLGWKEIDVSTIMGDALGDSTVGIHLKQDYGGFNYICHSSEVGNYEPYLYIVYEHTEFYVKPSGGSDSNSGTSWATAWATINKAATTVADGSTVHVGFGTYNTEPANNDVAPVNAGAVGIKYLPETATTGGGTGSVIVEVN